MGGRNVSNKMIDINYVDGITMVDDKGRIVYSVKYNPRFDQNCEEEEFKKIINKNLLEVYTTIAPEESTLLNCIKTGVTIYESNQVFCDFTGRVLNTQNITIPIIKMGKVLGAVELSKDITTIQDVSDDCSRFFMQTRAVSDKNECSIANYTFSDIITRNAKMLENINKSKMIASSPSSVLIYGATGTGKELFVQSIHNYGLRRNKPFIVQNCAALPETLFESILFGTVKGAFTGAIDKPGLFELANGGTLFLDEINSMPLSLQSKLLRVIQDGVVRKIGGIRDIKVDVRIIAAMNVDPTYAISSKQLREDLFYRLNVMSIKLVPLCERKEDITLLTEYFIKKYNGLLNKNVEGVTKDVEILFSMHNWPGNVRELQHVVEASMNIVNSGKIDVKHLPIYLDEVVNDDNRFCEIDDIKPLNDVIEMVERNLIKKALEKSGGNITKASKLLKVPRQTLQYKIYKYGLVAMEIVDIG